MGGEHVIHLGRIRPAAACAAPPGLAGRGVRGACRALGLADPGVRLLVVVSSLFGGAGLLLYLWLWAFTPLAASDSDDAPRRRFPLASILLAAGAVAAVIAVWQAEHGAGAYRTIMLATLLTACAVAWSLAFDRPDPERSERYGVLVRSLSAALLVVTGVLLLFSQGARPDALTAVFAVAIIVLGAGVVAAPGVVRLWADLMTERAARVREEERAEIAAHLHDSVLQTLALIQNRAGASTEVARLARAQERELRDWLFAGSTPTGNDLATELREVAAAIELDYPVRLDVVAAGESIGPSNTAILAAAREAMLNAARHAGGDVSVLPRELGGWRRRVRSRPGSRRRPGRASGRPPGHPRVHRRSDVPCRRLRHCRRRRGRHRDRDPPAPRHDAGRPCMISVLIVDDHSIFRSGLRADLDVSIEVLGEAADVDEAVARIAALKPEVVLLDVHLPGGAGGGGAEVIRRSAASWRRHGSSRSAFRTWPRMSSG